MTYIEEIRIYSSGVKRDLESREKTDNSGALQNYADSDTIKQYIDKFNKKTQNDENVLITIVEAV
ncbi:DNA polymerase I, partial [Pseudomonas syringae pv. tagetis]